MQRALAAGLCLACLCLQLASSEAGAARFTLHKRRHLRRSTDLPRAGALT